MIEITTEKVMMPPIDQRRFRLTYINNKWYIRDTDLDELSKCGKFDDLTFRVYYLNKSYYKSITKEK